MMKKVLLLIPLVGFFSLSLLGQAGDDRLGEILSTATSKIAADEEGWVNGGGLGFDFAQLALINPRVGAGSNRIGFGGLGTVFANYKKGKVAWDNIGSLQLAAQRLGGSAQPFQKNLDMIRLASKAGYQAGSEKLYMAVEANFQTLLLKTYEGNLLTSDTLGLLAQFASPLTVAVSPGLDYKPNEHWSIFYSPASMRYIYVANDEIAALNVHGNEKGTNSFLQLGSNLKAGYNNKFADDRLSWSSTLDLYANYLDNPGNIDVLWTNDLGVQIFGNFSINLVTELFYDDDIDVQIDLDNDGIAGEAAEDVTGFNRSELAPTVSFTEAILIKYNFIF